MSVIAKIVKIHITFAYKVHRISGMGVKAIIKKDLLELLEIK